MAYRNKVYVAFDGDHDMYAYRAFKMWGANPNFDFDFYDAHDLNTALDSSQESTIKRKLRERFSNSKLFVLIVGEHTKYLYKFVKWEIEVAIDLNLPIIVVNLNDNRQTDELLPPILRDELLVSVPFGEKIIKYAMDTWPNLHVAHRQKGEFGNYYYKDSVYDKL